ncbi:MAG: PAS domain-containing hybrid sensor histidine kinase/response regulator [Candidatus Manganitrophaceae bacterium]|nr:MAG: PAS domain-containing hybrid sensor histidine kinase/response regulator [Candidatus Manganitrophaceae bacterium]
MGTRPDIKRLQSRLDSYRLLVEEAKDYAIFLLDLEGNVTSWNLGAERIKGYRPQEIIGKHFSTFYTEEDRKAGRPERNLQHAFKEGRFEDEGWRIRKDGSPFWADVVITRIEDEQGNLIGFSKITRDLTERKRAEDEIRKLKEDLEHRVEERTAELKEANKILKQRTAEAEAADRLKSQFVSNVSHELRTPINAIIGYADLLKSEVYGPVAGEQREALEGIERNAGDLARLVNDMLDLAKIVSGKMSLERTQVNLGALIEAVAADLRPFSEKKGFPIRCVFERELPRIESDASKIKQILVNLLSNAVKFTDRGEITVRARKRGDRDGVEVVVQDTGIGIRPEELPKIFDPFHQVDGASTREYGGVGLGLAIVKELLQLLDGEIRVESTYGKGSAFTFLLPMRGQPDSTTPS